MNARRVTFSRHAETVLAEREIEREWVLRTIAEPETVEPDTARGTVDAFRCIPEHGGRILHVAYADRDDRLHVVTVFFDRKRARWQKTG